VQTENIKVIQNVQSLNWLKKLADQPDNRNDRVDKRTEKKVKK
jgi:hypothetical protein